MKDTVDFDCYADSYDLALGDALAASGESREYFALGRVNWLAARLSTMAEQPRAVLDFGCGTGSATPLLLELLKAQVATGVDTSLRSLEVARKNHGSQHIRFLAADEYQPSESVDIAYCNGVFHHIPAGERAGALQFIYRSLRPGGFFSFWENNPWNPGTRYVMAHCAFDRDAVTIPPFQARKLLRSEGFVPLQMDFHFIFPRALRALRPIESLASRLPLGAQYHILCQKPVAAR